jgi:lipopolysaccharide export system protein LptA
MMSAALMMPAPAASLGTEKTPIAIDADSLEVIQDQRKAIFKGNVLAKQADMVIRSQKMTVYYDAVKKENANTGMGALSRIEVEGSVHLVTSTESADADRGIYDAVREKVFLYGRVVLKRGENILNGAALEYNMATGSSLLTGGEGGTTPQSSGGRVRGIFVPKQE